MGIVIDIGHWLLVAVIGMMMVERFVSSLLVKKERHDLTLKLMAVKGDGVLDTYVAGVKTLKEPPRDEPSIEEAFDVVNKWEENDIVEVD